MYISIKKLKLKIIIKYYKDYKLNNFLIKYLFISQSS